MIDFWAKNPIGQSMERDHLSRKLVVILHADVVGSTSLVQQNETLAHERIQAAFHQFSETINSYGGITRELLLDAESLKSETALVLGDFDSDRGHEISYHVVLLKEAGLFHSYLIELLYKLAIRVQRI